MPLLRSIRGGLGRAGGRAVSAIPAEQRLALASRRAEGDGRAMKAARHRHEAALEAEGAALRALKLAQKALSSAMERQATAETDRDRNRAANDVRRGAKLAASAERLLNKRSLAADKAYSRFQKAEEHFKASSEKKVSLDREVAARAALRTARQKKSPRSPKRAQSQKAPSRARRAAGKLAGGAVSAAFLAGTGVSIDEAPRRRAPRKQSSRRFRKS